MEYAKPFLESRVNLMHNTNLNYWAAFGLLLARKLKSLRAPATRNKGY
jgi:hypothetical protein